MNARSSDISLRLVEVNQTHAMISRWECAMYNGAPVDVRLSSSLSPNPSAHTVAMTVNASYTTVRGQIRRQLLDCSVEAVFYIEGDDVKLTGKSTIVDETVLRLMLGTAIGALRGIIAMHTRNTFLHHYPLPIYRLDVLVEDILQPLEPVRL